MKDVNEDLLELANKIENKNNGFTNLATNRDVLPVILREYHKVCDENGFDYEFHYIDDVLNNAGSYFELTAFFDKYTNL